VKTRRQLPRNEVLENGHDDLVAPSQPMFPPQERASRPLLLFFFHNVSKAQQAHRLFLVVEVELSLGLEGFSGVGD